MPRDQAVEKWRRDRPTQTVFLGGLPRSVEANDVGFDYIYAIHYLYYFAVFAVKQWQCLFYTTDTHYVSMVYAGALYVSICLSQVRMLQKSVNVRSHK